MDDETFGRTIHERLLSGDPAAPEEISARWLDPLVAELARAFPAIARRDEALIWQAVVESLLDYIQRPTIFHSDRSPLRKFLFFAARGDLLNALAGEQRRAARERPLESVELSTAHWNNVYEGNTTGGSVEDAALEHIDWNEGWRTLAPHFPDEQDRALLALMLQGERKTERYSAILGLDQLDSAGRQREVKRHKDRLGKRLRRLGEKLRE